MAADAEVKAGIEDKTANKQKRRADLSLVDSIPAVEGWR
jgi:hypothetical protein